MLIKATEIVNAADLFLVIGTSLCLPSCRINLRLYENPYKYVMNPKPDELNVNSSFQIIAKNATTGIKILVKKIK